MERNSLERVWVTTCIAPQLDRAEKEVNHTINARKSHNMPDQGYEVVLCTARALHQVSFNEDLGAFES